jgi:hypothetical protein
MATKKTVKKVRKVTQDRFYLLPKATVNLIKAEEEYLRASGWTCAGIEGLWSQWTYPGYVATYSRFHAVILAKTEDQNVGIA